ncbi:hypothetical protein OHV05_34680 [Kitasatospora sp. NBC_00070]
MPSPSGRPVPSLPGDAGKLEEIWDDIISELDSDYGAYQYVSHVGLGA